MEKSIILTDEQIQHKTRRIAYQIYETFSKENEVIIAGINGNGFVFANNIATILKDISDLEVNLCEVIINKKKQIKKSVLLIFTCEYVGFFLLLAEFSCCTTYLRCQEELTRLKLKNLP